MDDTPCTLDDLAPGQTATVQKIAGDDPVARRLADLGFWPGSVVRLERQAPLGDPILVRVGGYRLALRRAESRRIHLVETSG